MPKKQDPERFKTFDVMLPQGARARHAKAVRLMELADESGRNDGLSQDARGRLMIRSTDLIERLRRERPDTMAEIARIREAQRERGWKLIRLDVEAFAQAEAEAGGV